MKSFNDIGLLAVRLVAGGLLALHGFQKLSDPSGFVGALEGMSAPAPQLSAWLLMLGEAGLGLLIVFGLLTRVAGALVIVMFTIVYANMYLSNGIFTFGEGGNGLNGEDVILYATFGLLFAALGAGKFSLDNLAGSRFGFTSNPEPVAA